MDLLCINILALHFHLIGHTILYPLKGSEVKPMRRPNIGFCYPGYRYCGPGCSGPGAPVNEVDKCCQYHDHCYAQRHGKQYCDAIFLQCLNSYKNPSTKMGRDANLFSRAIILKNYFS